MATPAASGHAAGGPEDIILRAEGITKVFPGTVALDGVDFNVRRGQVNALIGENGAGKSTLMKILAGVEQPTRGRVVLDGEAIQLSSPRDAARYGIAIIYQELNLFPNLSVADNIFAGRELRGRYGTVNYKAQEQIALELLQRLEEPISPRALVEELRVGQQQAVEIAKALAQDVRILIMDEPTSALSAAEVRVLFRIIAELKAAGVSIIYISHKLDELIEVADQITVLRDGKVVAEAPAGPVTIPWIVEKMVGRRPEALYHKENHVQPEVLLRVESLTLMHPHVPNRHVLDHVSFALRAGEILGFYGLMGAGRTELLECLLGGYPAARGSIWLAGRPVTARTIGERIGHGLALVPEDRQRHSIVPTQSVKENITLASLRRYLKWGFLSRRSEAASVRRSIESLSIKVASPQQPITSLSGGNQQKVVVARVLLTSPRVLLMDEPTRGIDVGAKGDMFRIMNDLAGQGFGILFVSSELNEVLAMSDRVLVMSRGRITAEFDRADATEAALVAACALGHGAASTKEGLGSE